MFFISFPFSRSISMATQAPNPVFSIIISPVVLASGVFLLLRLFPLLNLTPALFEILKIFGITSAILAALSAAKENEIKNTKHHPFEDELSLKGYTDSDIQKANEIEPIAVGDSILFIGDDRSQLFSCFEEHTAIFWLCCGLICNKLQRKTLNV